MDKVGRKKTQCIDFAVTGVFAFLLMICSGRTIETAFLFVARAGIAGAFQATYVYTPGIIPNSVSRYWVFIFKKKSE
jgi:hypothetical protein